MRKLLSILRVKTFFKLKISLISILMLTSIVIAGFCLSISINDSANLTNQLVNNQKSSNLIAKKLSEFNEKDTYILLKTLNRNESNYSDTNLNSDINECQYLLRCISNEPLLDTLLREKYLIYKQINFEVDINAHDVKKDVYLVEKINRKMFKKNNDTIYKRYSFLDKELLNKKVDKSNEDFKKIKLLIEQNNIITIEIQKISNDEIKNVQEKALNLNIFIYKKLDSNLKNYIIISGILIALFVLFIYLLFLDINKKIKSETRNKSIIDLLIKNNN